MMTKEILIRARKLIEKPERWAKRTYGLYGGPCCAEGALMRVVRPEEYRDALRALLAAACPNAEALSYPYLHGLSAAVTKWNDSHTHAEVLAAFDRAIEACDEV
jgi:hypothetical protein